MAILTHDLGKDFVLKEFRLPKTQELIGYTVTGPKGPNCKGGSQGRCGGLCAIKPYTVPIGEKMTRTYSVWQVTGEWPHLTFNPSVMCKCGFQHSFIVNGAWQ